MTHYLSLMIRWETVSWPVIWHNWHVQVARLFPYVHEQIMWYMVICRMDSHTHAHLPGTLILLHLKILLALDFRKYLKSMWRSWSAVPLCAYWYGHHMCHCSDFFQRVCITMSLDLWHLTCCIKEFSYQNGWRMSDPHLMSDCNSSPGSIVCRNHHCVRKASSNSIYCLFALHSKKMFNTHALPSLLH